MKIMVVGSSGYIGRHVVKKLAAQGAEVVAFDLVSAPPQWSVAGVPFVQGNMTTSKKSWRRYWRTASRAWSPWAIT